MMDYLLDTQVVIWFINGDERVPTSVRYEVSNPKNTVSITIVSLWEIAIKRSINKLTLSTNLQNIQSGIVSRHISVLPITVNHLEAVETLAYQGKHRDPFDRLIISQAMVENLTLISSDPHFKNYPVKLFW
jgi:PIN domain nuclease of toxin-antitoxin system